MFYLEFSIFIGIFSSILQILGYFEYGRKVFSDKIKPNIASWGIWAVSAVLETLSYILLSGDVVKNLLPIICALCAVIFFILVYRKGKFEKFTTFEKKIVFMDLLVVAIWYITSSPLIANILFIVTAIISFIPIYIHVFKNPKNEHAYPWLIWSGAYLLMTITVLLRWEKWEDLIYPFTFFVLHVIMYYLSLDSRTRE